MRLQALPHVGTLNQIGDTIYTTIAGIVRRFDHVAPCDHEQRYYVGSLDVVTNTRNGYVNIIREDLQSWRKPIKDANIRVDALR